MNDGMGQEFYSHNLAVISDDLCDVIKQMFWTGNITQQQKRSVIVCMPKARGNQKSTDHTS